MPSRFEKIAAPNLMVHMVVVPAQAVIPVRQVSVVCMAAGVPGEVRRGRLVPLASL